MEERADNSEVKETSSHNRLHQVTPFSKYLAMVLFIILPFVGGWVGYSLNQNSYSEVVKMNVEQQQESVTDQAISISRHHFSWNGQAGVLEHRCVQVNDEIPLLYIPSEEIGNDADYSYCSQRNVLSVEFAGQDLVIEEFINSTTTDHRRVNFVGFTQSEFSDIQDRSGLSTSTENLSDKLMVGFIHLPCDFTNDDYCWTETFGALTHLVSFSETEASVQKTNIRYFRHGFSQASWNDQRTAFVIRGVADDIQPSFRGWVIGQETHSFDFAGKLSLSRNAAEWTEEEKNFAQRMWSNEEVEWLGNYTVRIYDTVFDL